MYGGTYVREDGQVFRGYLYPEGCWLVQEDCEILRRQSCPSLFLLQPTKRLCLLKIKTISTFPRQWPCVWPDVWPDNPLFLFSGPLGETAGYMRHLLSYRPCHHCPLVGGTVALTLPKSGLLAAAYSPSRHVGGRPEISCRHPLAFPFIWWLINDALPPSYMSTIRGKNLPHSLSYPYPVRDEALWTSHLNSVHMNVAHLSNPVMQRGHWYCAASPHPLFRHRKCQGPSHTYHHESGHPRGGRQRLVQQLLTPCALLSYELQSSL